MTKFLGCTAIVFLLAGAAVATPPDARAVLFCNLAAKHFAAFLPPSPARQVLSDACRLGTQETKQVVVGFPPLATDSLQRERIVATALGQTIADEPDLGPHAFSVRSGKAMAGKHGTTLFTVGYYVRANAQIFSISFWQHRPFTTADLTATRTAIKAFLADMD